MENTDFGSSQDDFHSHDAHAEHVIEYPLMDSVGNSFDREQAVSAVHKMHRFDASYSVDRLAVDLRRTEIKVTVAGGGRLVLPARIGAHPNFTEKDHTIHLDPGDFTKTKTKRRRRVRAKTTGLPMLG